jgi:transcription initiation factor TFIID subunit TAF12
MSTEGFQASELFQKWEELKVLIESLENDILKNVKGNKSAGVRARKGLRLLKSNASEIVKVSLSNDKES